MISRRVVLMGVGATAGHWLISTGFAQLPEVEGLAESDARRMQIQMEATGQLQLDPTGKKVTTTPFRVRADFDYVEKSLADSSTTWAARDFANARANIQVGRGSTTSELSASDEVIVHRIEQIDDSQVKHEFTRSSQSLAAEEIDLIHVPGIASVVERWIADLSTKTIGESWVPEAWTVAAVLAIDSVTESKLQCRLRRRTAEKTEVTVQGTVSGVANSVPTEIVVTGRLFVDNETGALTSSNWDLQEKRTIGPATPGFEARTKIEAVITAPVTWGAEQQAQLEAVQGQGLASTNRLVFKSDHHDFRLGHASHWKVIGDNPQAAVLRFVDAGDLIAQAHMTRLKDLPAGGKLSKQKYREDVAKAIQEAEGQIVDVTESTTARGYQALRVVVSADVSGVAIQWIYYHITATSGQRAGWVITLEQDRIDRFGAEDQILLEDFEILEPTEKPVQAKAKTAEKASAVNK